MGLAVWLACEPGGSVAVLCLDDDSNNFKYKHKDVLEQPVDVTVKGAQMMRAMPIVLITIQCAIRSQRQ